MAVTEHLVQRMSRKYGTPLLLVGACAAVVLGGASAFPIGQAVSAKPGRLPVAARAAFSPPFSWSDAFVASANGSEVSCKLSFANTAEEGSLRIDVRPRSQGFSSDLSPMVEIIGTGKLFPTAFSKGAGTGDAAVVALWNPVDSTSIIDRIEVCLEGGSCKVIHDIATVDRSGRLVPGKNSVVVPRPDDEFGSAVVVLGVGYEPLHGQPTILQVSFEDESTKQAEVSYVRRTGRKGAGDSVALSQIVDSTTEPALLEMRSLEFCRTLFGGAWLVLSNEPSWSTEGGTRFYVLEVLETEDRGDPVVFGAGRVLSREQFLAEFPVEQWNLDYAIAR